MKLLAALLVLSGGCSSIAGADRSAAAHPGMDFRGQPYGPSANLVTPFSLDGKAAAGGCVTCAH